MTDLEETALHTSPITPLCWVRKVDDTFVILQPDHDPKTLLNHLNAQHPRMQFTMEEEAERQLPFLDVRVQKDPDNKLHTSVYRKPTHTGHLVEQTINIILSPRERPPRQQTAPFVISLPYIGTASHQIRRLLKHHANIDTVFQRGRTIQNILSANGKPPTSKKEDPAGAISRLIGNKANIDVTFSSGKTIRIHLQANSKGTSSASPNPR
ncbi:uncharacterized protein [Haliotis cracherodii]|uniref:uncharacterized protein n=1 Tax=Haliotis cracherodii TaxID=6455 RepID=UPI0039ECA795